MTSVPESNVYVLDYNEEKRVFSRNLDLVNRAGDANEILTDVLGLPTPSPIWVEQKIDYIVTKYSSAGRSGNEFAGSPISFAPKANEPKKCRF